MTLTLTITNADRLDNGSPSEFVLNRRGAVIGRSPTCDWSLPDPRQYISSRHCEVTFRDGFYTLADVSTNGTILNGAADRMAEPRRIEHGDRFLVGQYQIAAALSGEAAAAVERREEAQAQATRSGEWAGWDSHAGGAAPVASPPPVDPGWGVPPPAGDGGWGAPPPAPAGVGWHPPAAAAPSGGSDWGPAPAVPAPSSSWAPQAGPGLARVAAPAARGTASVAPGGGWAPTAPAEPAPPVRSAWDTPAPPQQGASAWSSAAPDRPAPPTADDIWGRIAEGNVVDWARGGFGQPQEARRDPLGLDKPAAGDALPPAPPRMAQFDGAPDPAGAGWGAAQPVHSGDGWAPAPPAAASPARSDRVAAAAPSPPAGDDWGAPPAAMPAPPSPRPPAASPSQGAGDPGPLVQAFAAAAGLAPGQLRSGGGDVLERAGALLRQLVAGLVVMVEARARAKSQMGAEATSLSFDGNNPIKFARAPEQALAQLLNPRERGFMEAGPAIEDAFYDLQSHQMATLKAMQGALRATLDRFSPNAIRGRAESKGLMARIMPGAREAALWQAYEREFGGVAQGSDEAFMDVFAKEFRKAYEDQANARRAGAPPRR